MTTSRHSGFPFETSRDGMFFISVVDIFQSLLHPVLFQKETFLLFYHSGQFFFRRHISHIFGSKKLLVSMQYRVFRNRIICIGTEQYANGRVVFFLFHQIVIHAYIHIQLSNVLMGQLMGLKFKDDESFHLKIIEHQINIEIRCIGNYMLLPFHKSKSASKLHNEFFKIINQSLLQLRFGKLRILLESHKLSNHWILYIFQRVDVFGLRHGQGTVSQLFCKSSFVILG